MIRKAIIVVLTLGTVGTAILAVATLVLPRPIIWGRGWKNDGDIFGGNRWAMTVHRGISWVVHSSKSDKDLSPYRFGTNWCFVERAVHPIVRSSFTTMLKLPLWIPFVLFGAYPTITFIRGPLWRYRRRKRGECLACGYNLTGLPKPRCPECGTEIRPS